MKHVIKLPNRDITDKSRKYFCVHIVALNQTFSIFWTFTGHLAALNQTFECTFLFGATKCPEKYFRHLSVMSLLGHITSEMSPAIIFWIIVEIISNELLNDTVRLL